jgi:hypothetical protein
VELRSGSEEAARATLALDSLGCSWRPSEKGLGSRIAGKSAIHARLALRSDGYLGLVVFRNCNNLIRTLPTLPCSHSNAEDVETNCEDHAYDALRYGLTRKVVRCELVRVGGPLTE